MVDLKLGFRAHGVLANIARGARFGGQAAIVSRPQTLILVFGKTATFHFTSSIYRTERRMFSAALSNECRSLRTSGTGSVCGPALRTSLQMERSRYPSTPIGRCDPFAFRKELTIGRDLPANFRSPKGRPSCGLSVKTRVRPGSTILKSRQ